MIGGRGFQQRAAARRAGRVDNRESVLGEFLLELWAFGEMSATRLQTIAMKATQDHDSSPNLLTTLAGFGSKGEHPSNTHRDLLKYAIARCPEVPKPMKINVPMVYRRFKLGPAVELPGSCEHSMHTPFDWFSFLYKSKPESFRARFLGGQAGEIPDILESFWGAIPESDLRKSHLRSEFRARADYVDDRSCFRRAVPIVLHGDGVPCAQMSMDTLSWGGYMGLQLSTLDSKILISGLLNRTVGKDTKEVYNAAIAWSLTMLWSGKFPELDVRGEPWDVTSPYASCGGHELCPGHALFGAIWVIKGDMDWLSNSLNLEHSASHQMCVWCRANDIEPEDQELIDRYGDDSTPWNDIESDAEWRSTTYLSADQWFLCHGGRLGCHPILSVPGASGLSVMVDALHTLDLGLTHHILGNTLFCLCWKDHYFGPGLSASQRLDRCWARIEKQYKDRGTVSRVGALSLTSFTNPQKPHQVYPCLATRIKAADSRHLVPILSSIFDDVCDRGGEEDLRISALLQALTQVYEAMDCHEPTLPPRDLAKFQSKMAETLHHYRWLCARAIAAHVSLWNEVPKHHYCQHLADQAAQQNPRYCWTYPDEDFMGYVKSITEACLAGTKAHRATEKVLEKWGFGVAMRMSRAR